MNTTHEDAEAPRGQWELRVAHVWQDTLGVGPIRRDDDFFALGGDSMKGLRCMLLIHPDLEWADIFNHPTVRTLAEHLRTVTAAPGTDRADSAANS